PLLELYTRSASATCPEKPRSRSFSRPAGGRLRCGVRSLRTKNEDDQSEINRSASHKIPDTAKRACCPVSGWRQVRAANALRAACKSPGPGGAASNGPTIAKRSLAHRSRSGRSSSPPTPPYCDGGEAMQQLSLALSVSSAGE